MRQDVNWNAIYRLESKLALRKLNLREFVRFISTNADAQMFPTQLI